MSKIKGHSFLSLWALWFAVLVFVVFFNFPSDRVTGLAFRNSELELLLSASPCSAVKRVLKNMSHLVSLLGKLFSCQNLGLLNKPEASLVPVCWSSDLAGFSFQFVGKNLVSRGRKLNE